MNDCVVSEPEDALSSPGDVPVPAGNGSRKERDPVLDLVRAGALVIVVLWHWVFTTVVWNDTGPHVGNPVNRTPGMWALTWVLQVMPLFFAVGGALHATDHSPTKVFIRKRLARLVPPVLPLVIPAGVLWAVAVAAGWTAVANTVVLVVSPLWFLAVYLACVALVPAARRLHTRVGFAAPAVFAAPVVALDAARFHFGWDDSAPLIAAMFICTWAAVHQGGFVLRRLRDNRPAALGVAGCGLAGLVVLSTWGPFPRPMVGVPGQAISNMAPPNTMVLALAALQIGLLAAAWAPLGAAARRCSAALGWANRWTMTIYVWHLLAFGVFWAALTALGWHTPAQPTPTWWLQRPLWLAGPALLAAPLCAATARFDNRRRPAAPAQTRQQTTGKSH